MRGSRFASASLFSICFLFSTAGAFGTSIVIIRTPREIVVGADSMTTIEGRAPIQSCKIHRLKNGLYFVSAGYANDLLAGGTYDVVHEVHQAAGEAQSLNAAVDATRVAFRAAFLQQLEQRRLQEPDHFERNFYRLRIVQVALFGIEQGDPIVEKLTFRAFNEVPDLRIESHRERCPGDCPGDVAPIFIGEDQAMRNHIGETEFRERDSLTSIAEKLIHVAISASPNTVGPPVVVFRLQERGASWVKGETICRHAQ